MNAQQFAGISFALMVACSSQDPATSLSTGGAGGTAAGGTGGASGSSGAVGAAGSAHAGGGLGGQGGTASGGGGQGGNSSGGSAGSAGSSGSGNATPPVPSDGCGVGGRPAGGIVSEENEYIFDFPESYDGTTPLPVLLGLHANSNPINQIQNLTNGSELQTKFVRVFPKSTGSGWNYDTDAPRIDAVFDELFANYCVDESRIFVTGHSSGAQMAVQMLCQGDDRFKAAAPVAASKYCSSVDPIPVMYIQGMADAQRGGSNGKDVVDVFVASNGCTSDAQPYTEVAACDSKFDGLAVDPGCVTYQGCTEPTVWCSHDDNGYNLTDGHMHGWPCFASTAMADFFQTLP